MRRTYHTADIQQGIRDQIQNIYQGPDKDPQIFSTRINHALSLSRYGAQVSVQLLESTFMNGLHRNIAMQVRETPVHLDLDGKITYAQRIWIARRPIGGLYTVQQVLPQNL